VPALPEVETIVRDLAPRLEGYRIAGARLAKTDVLRRVSKPRLLRTLKGNMIEEVIRRAKHAVFRLASGHRLIVQPRMTGSLVVYDRALSRDEAKYAVLTCTIDDGRLLVYRDVRRLGTVWLLDQKGWDSYTSRIGPEPLEETFTPFVFADRLKGTRAAIKKTIMDQRRVAGVCIRCATDEHRGGAVSSQRAGGVGAGDRAIRRFTLTRQRGEAVHPPQLQPGINGEIRGARVLLREHAVRRAHGDQARVGRHEHVRRTFEQGRQQT
jgi:formamidopyrimidine-DNA glycosylase